MRLYRAVYPSAGPVAVEVDDARAEYPHEDPDGFKIYDSTHFASEAEAWERLLREAHAAEYLDNLGLKAAEEETERRRTALLASARVGIALREAHAAWKEGT